MAESIREVTVRVKIEQQKAKLEVPGAKQAAAEVENVSNVVVDLTKNLSNTTNTTKNFHKEIHEATTSVQDNFQETTKTVNKFGLEASKAGIDAADKFKAAGEGAFTLLRGLAFLFSDSEEGFRRMIQNVAILQGGFDLFKGTVTTVKAVSEGLAIWTGATQAAAASNTILAGTNTAVAATAGTATLAMVPLSPLILGISAAVSAIAVGWQFFWRNAPNDVKTAKGEVDAFNKSLEMTETALGMFGRRFGQEEKFFQRGARAQELRFGERELGGERVGVEEKVANALAFQEKTLERLRVEKERALKATTDAAEQAKIEQQAFELESTILLDTRTKVLQLRQQERQQADAATAKEQAAAQAQRGRALAFGLLDPQSQQQALRGVAAIEAGRPVSPHVAAQAGILRPDLQEQVAEQRARAVGGEQLRQMLEAADRVAEKQADANTRVATALEKLASGYTELSNRLSNVLELRRGAISP